VLKAVLRLVSGADGLDCGLCYINEEEIKESLKRRASGPEEIDEIEGMAFENIEE
jgi:hypothetical protein